MATATLIIPGHTRSSSESGGATNLTFTRSATTVTVVSDTGTDAEIPAATVSLAGVMSATQATATDKLINTPPGSLVGRAPGIAGPAQALDIGDGFDVSAGRIDVLGQMTVQVNELGVRLVNDEASPGNSEYYGTSAGGVKGYHPLPPGGTTNLNSNRNAEEVFVTSSTGTPATIPKATGLLAGVISASDQNKLNNIEPFATANSPDATLLDRANHTGTQPPSSIDGSTTVGRALMTLANPSAVRFARINADNSVTLLDGAGFRDAIAACVEDDARLSDARTPLAHTHPPTDIAGSTTLGQALMTAPNPSAVRYVRINADNSVSLLDAAAFAAAIGAGAGSPAGSGTELQFKNGAAFGALPGSSVSGSTLTVAELRVNAGDPATGLRGTHIGGVTTLAFFGTGSNGFFYGSTGATSIAYRGAGFRIEGTGSADSAALLQIGISNRVILRAHTLNNLRLGPADAASPAPQSLSVQSASGTNQSAASATLIVDGAQGTGSGNGGAVCIRTAPAGASGAAPNTYVDTITARPGRGVAVSNGNFAASSDCIGEITVLRGSTSGTTPVILSESALGGGLPVLPNTVIQGIVLVQGMSETGDTVRYARQVCVKNFAGTTSLHSAVVTVGIDDSSPTALSITANDTTDTLDIQVTGTSGANWRWNAVIFGGELVRNVPS